ncbi:MAG TPA: peptidoglycan recognition family protein, partial [Polyangia bacterium]
MKRRLLGLAIFLVGCSGLPAAAPSGPLAQSVQEAAARNHVPNDLMLSIAKVEGGLLLPRVRILRVDDDVPVAGVLELRHGQLDSLARGAALMNVDENALRIDTDLGTEAGARVLAELGQKTGAREGDLSSWAPALEELSGLSEARQRVDYARQVLSVAQAGGTFPGRGGEQVHIAAHPDVTLPDLPMYQAQSATPDFPGAIWFTTSCTNKCDTTRTAGNSVVHMIVIHDTEGGWSASVATLQNDSGKSVHYIVDADGSRVGQFVPETYTAWHAGNYYVNQRSVGIEHVGVAADASGYTDGLYKKSVELVKSIRSRWTVPLDRTHIIGHYQVADGNHIAESSPSCADTLDACETSPNYGGADNHRDPGYYWQWCQYMQMLGGSCTCNDAWPLWNCTTDKTEAVRCTGGQVQIDSCTAGCVSQPIGTDDVCNHTPASMPDLGGEPPATDDGGAIMTNGPDGGDPGTGSGGGSGLNPPGS